MRSGHFLLLWLRVFVVLFIPVATVASMPIGASAAPGSMADEWSPSLMQDKEQEKQERQQEKEQQKQEKEQQKQIKEQEKQQREQEKEQQKQEKEQEKQERKEEKEQQDDPGNICSEFATLAAEENPTDAFDSQKACLAYIAAGGTPVELQTDPPPTTCPDWASLARTESPTQAFTSEQECLDYIDAGGTTVPVETPLSPCDDWASLARAGLPGRAFTSEQECLDYVAGGGNPVDHIPGVAVEPRVVVTSPLNCQARAQVSGFNPNTQYTGTLAGQTISITTNGDGEGASAAVTVSREGEVTATLEAPSGSTFSGSGYIRCVAIPEPPDPPF